MRQVRIPKGNGRFRTIYVPSHREREALRSLLPGLTEKSLALVDDTVVHGFLQGKSPVTNAKQHIGFQFTTNFDLQDFFDTVRVEHLRALSEEELEACLYEGAPRQGFPTSPACANIAAVCLDTAIKDWLAVNNLKVVYTRYADDLAFSYNEPHITGLLRDNIPVLVEQCGFKLNHKKIRTQSAHRGRRVITGVAVDDKLYPTRRSKRKLRAARHQGNTASAHGLKEWCKLKQPKPVLKPSLCVNEIELYTPAKIVRDHA